METPLNIAPSTLSVVPVEGRTLWRGFHCLPHTLYAQDPNWVPPLFLEREFHFQKKHNAFFQHARGEFWLAMRDGKPVGRITAQIDALHLEQHNDATGHFGFLEAVDDPAVFEALLTTAEAWLRAEGMQRVLGPVSFAMWDEPGLLIEGFDRPPNVLMGHHLPYYQHRIVERGYTQAQDLLAYEYPCQQPLNQELDRLIERARQKHSIVFRPLRMDAKNFPAEKALIRDIINDAWAENWGFVPMTQAEVDEIASLFKLFLPPEALVIAEYDGEPVGVTMMLPNINEFIKDLDGKLLPIGIFKMLWRMRKGAKSGRLALLGVRRRFWGTAMGAIVALTMIKTAQSCKLVRGVETAEISWILDSNTRIKDMIERVGCVPTKRYRIYEKKIA